MSGPRFDWSVNLGHILLLLSMFGALIAGYATYKVTIGDVENRLKALEKWQVEQTSINGELTRTLYTVREDVAVIRDRIERTWQK